MKRFVFSAFTIFCAGTFQPVMAATIEAVSFVDVTHRFSVNGGASPNGIIASVSGPTFDPNVTGSQINDAGAVVAVDEQDIQIGNASSNPPVPFISNRQFRVNRSDPTEFANAQRNLEVLEEQDEGLYVNNFAIGNQSVDRDGLAQIRIGSPNVAAQARSSYGISRVLTLENITNSDITFDVGGGFDAYLLSRYSGDGGLARTNTVINVLFSGLSADNLLYLDTGGTPERTRLTGGGASIGADLYTTDDGTPGMQFSASATAIGDGGFTEAEYDIFQLYRLRMTLEAGQSTNIELGFSQSSYVEYAPIASVPLPAGGMLLFSALALLGWRRF